MIVLSVSAFPPTSHLLTSFEPLVKFTRRDRELQDVKFLHVFLQISSWGCLPEGGDEAGSQHPYQGRKLMLGNVRDERLGTASPLKA